MKKAVLLLTLFAMLVTGSAVTAAPPSQSPDGEAYIVQPGDWLMKIAKDFYGDASAYRVIVEATNGKAAEDASFAVIDNPSLIRVGQKLWIPAQAQPVAAESELALEALKNAVYQGIYDEPVQLTDGKYEGEPFVPGGASRPTVVLHPEVYAFGDLNGDGVDDAAVILIENSGGSGNFRYLAAVINEGGAPVNVATQFIGDREQAQLISIDGNEITLDMVAHGPEDPMCCPTQKVTKVYQLEDEQLVEVLVSLEGTVWTLVSYGDPSDPQAVLEGSEITAQFDGAKGTVTGSAGCNSYFGAYEVDGDSLTVGPVGSTEMYCAAPENVMDQETAYLAALQSAASYQIVGNQLQIANADGATVLTFVMMQMTPLTGTTWQLAFYLDDDAFTSVLADTEITALFGDDGQLTGSAGCNNYFGSYEVEGDTITFGLLGSTLMACPEPAGIMDQEMAYFTALGSTVAYRIEGDELELIDADGTRVAQFVALPPASLAGTEWTLTAYNNGQDAVVSVLIGTEITAAFGDDGQVTGSAGCNNYFGSYEVDGETINFGLLGSTLMACAEPEGVMNQEMAYLEALGSVVTYHIEGDRLELIDADGTRVAQFTALLPVSLAGTEWTLTAYNNGQEAVVSVLIGTEITAAFGDDGRLAGSAGCNTYGASYEVDGDQITLGPAVTTRMWCPEPEGIMDQENAFLAALGSAATYRIQSDKLEMRDADGALALQFTAVSEATPTEPAAGEAYIVQPGDWLTKIAENFYGDAGAYRAIVEATNAKAAEDESFAVIDDPSLIRAGQKLWIPAQAAAASGIVGEVWQWVGTQTPTEETVVDDPGKCTIEFLPDGKVHVQADCNMAGGTYAIGDASHIKITITTTTLAACPPGSLGDQFIKELNGAVIYFFEGDNLLIDRIYDSGTMRFVKGG